MLEAEDYHSLNSRPTLQPEFYWTCVLHRAQANRLQERLQAFHCIIWFSSLTLSLPVHDLLAQVQDLLTSRGFHFLTAYDSGNPSFSLLQIRSGGRVLTSFGLTCRRVVEYFPNQNMTLEQLFYEAEGFKSPAWFPKNMDGTHILWISQWPPFHIWLYSHYNFQPQPTTTLLDPFHRIFSLPWGM